MFKCLFSNSTSGSVLFHIMLSHNFLKLGHFDDPWGKTEYMLETWEWTMHIRGARFHYHVTSMSVFFSLPAVICAKYTNLR